VEINRRHFLYILGATTLVTGVNSFPKIASAENIANNSETFKLPPLPYAYDALEPHIDAETMKFHHDKHHAAYTNNLNTAVNKYPQLKTKTAEQLLKDIKNIPLDIRKTVINNGGGYVNHKMFWEIMSPQGGGEPQGEIAKAINSNFGSFASFKEEFNKAGIARFGSGWAWLVLDKNRKLKVISTANQDSPFMENLYPVMGNDVWEHAYYLKYRNNRGDYLKNWWNVVNWKEINKRFTKATS
jgi:Fe-Mn family superoxide dismutase